jgi:hypothetical protein
MEEAEAPSPAEQIDRRAHELLALAYGDGSVTIFGDGPTERLGADKQAAEKLVRFRLAFYTDDARDRIEVTNSGRYWALNGGYLAFLKEDPQTGSGGRGRNPEMEALRTSYMKLRLNTFWISFGLSIAGFVMSLISLVVVWYFRGDPFR